MKATTADEVVEQFTAFDILHDQVEFARSFPDVKESQNAWVFDELHDDNFALNAQK